MRLIYKQSLIQGRILRLVKDATRSISTESSLMTNGKLDFSKLDKKWADKWKSQSPSGSLHPTKDIQNNDQTKKTFYSLSMFPYPSGVLHLGHLRVYTISDVLARFKRLRGYKVIHPMGWDAFGLPAENAAVERGIPPAEWTEQNISKMKEQMSAFLADFDWDREVNTSSADYYKWTQWIFLKLHEHGLVYQKEAEINWDPVDQTVLANEQVDSEGRSWRSGALVEKKKLTQWFIGITKYAADLNKDLEYLTEWPDKVKTMQRNWIGESHGSEIHFPVNGGREQITVFTSRPDTLFSVQFLALALDHPIVNELVKDDQELAKFIKEAERDTDPDTKAGYKLKSIKASIPIDISNNKSLKFDVPIYVAPYVIGGYGHGAVMGCPGHDDRDFEFWRLHEPTQETIQVVAPSADCTEVPNPYTDKSGVLSDKAILANGLESIGGYRGMSVKEAGALITKNLESNSLGKDTISYRLRDWLISRQRYWGAPIPIIHCHDCGPVPVPEKDLPVILPHAVDEHFGKGNPLGKIDSFVNCECPSCGGPAKRETDTMDTFMDSSWYFLRYLDPKNEELPLGAQAAKDMPVDLYVGGVEHAILHLLYSRFISKFLGDVGLWNGKDVRKEPFKKLITQGMVHGKTYTDPENGRFLKPDEVDLTDPSNPIIKKSGETALISFEKMSKSKYNGADPGECIKKYGADATRAHMLFSAPISDVLNWNEDQIAGTDRWLRRVIQLSERILEVPDTKVGSGKNKSVFKNIKLNDKVYEELEFNEDELKLYNETQGYVQGIAKSIEVDFSFNTIISDMMKLSNAITTALNSKSDYNKELLVDSYRKLLICMSSVTPATAEECWERLANGQEREVRSIFHESFPECQPIESQTESYNVFINGKHKGTIVASKTLVEEGDDAVLKEVSKYDDISSHITGSIKRIIRKPKLISIISK
ncbi:NAM2 [[Candida] subhashii]|uniref:leucine--tRNA ligase n=1 Tax=[Candida] subhashii TaxID=561895 RepID=A0A8J5QKI2_9ASCO|nr:NAM2 [[Candida] subhashii]KAG7666396.1 NAM2 [[Candida] subhashii]